MMFLLGFRLHDWPMFSDPKTDFPRKHLPQPPDPIGTHSKPIVASQTLSPTHKLCVFFLWGGWVETGVWGGVWGVGVCEKEIKKG